MNYLVIINLLRSIFILLIVGVAYDYFLRKKNSGNIGINIAVGVVLGVIGIVLALTPLTFKAGVFFDFSSIVLIISGLLFGIIPTVIAMIVFGVGVFLVGGPGSWLEVTCILTSGMTGLLWSHFRPTWQDKNKIAELACMGVFLALIISFCFVLFGKRPWTETLQIISIPTLLFYPLTLILSGKYLTDLYRLRINSDSDNLTLEQWLFALEGTGEGLWDWNLKTDEIQYSKQWKSMLGYQDDDFVKSHSDWDKLLHPDDRVNVNRSITGYLQGEIENYEPEYRFLCKDGTYKWIFSQGKVISRDKNGNPLRFIGTHKDISDRKEKELLLAHERYLIESLLKYTPESIFFKDLDCKFIRVNDASARNMGCNDSSHVIGKSDFDFFVDEFANISLQQEKEIMRTGKPLSIEENGFRKDGKENWGLTNKMPLRDINGNIIGIFGISIDITKRKHVEQALTSSQEELKNFAAHLQVVREEERILLAREIHDELGQMLIALKIDLGILRQAVIKNTNEIDKDKTNSEFGQVLDLLDKTIKTTRKIMTGLRPEVLELIGIGEAVRIYMKEFSERYQIDCKFKTAASDIIVDSQKSIALFRILQEALTNIAKHANATEVTVNLDVDADKIILKISDNGIGIDENLKARPDSYGLIGMKERVYLLDGKISITGQPEKGTTVMVEMPYNTN